MRVAFFDLDETLIAMKSMFAFLEFYLARVDGDASSYAKAMGVVEARVAQGATREDINSYYYSLYCGHRQTTVRRHAQAFFTSIQVRYNAAVVERLRVHQGRGDRTIVVSGAMQDIIFPVTGPLVIDHHLCTTPEIQNGRYTGRILKQAIGAGKAALVENYCLVHQIDPRECIAYGDHHSDQHMLNCVGMGVAVHPDVQMRALATQNQWEIIQ